MDLNDQDILNNNTIDSLNDLANTSVENIDFTKFISEVDCSSLIDVNECIYIAKASRKLFSGSVSALIVFFPALFL